MITLYDFSVESDQQFLLTQWADDLNHNCTPKDVSSGSGVKVWWRCGNGHTFECSVFDRAKRGRGCPYCAGRKVLLGYNDLASQKPELAAQWHLTYNGDLTPEMVTCGTNQQAWWICERGHEYQASISNRVAQHTGCPYCAGKKVLPGFNDLASQNAELAAQWHQSLNGDLTPQMITSRSNRKVWWMCEKGHEWEAYVYSRSGDKGNGCPYCAELIVVPGVNDMATTHPHLIAQWNFKRNTGLSPNNVSPGSQKKVWWVCEKGHEWKTEVRIRTRGNECPFCTNRITLPGFNDICTSHPDIAAQWDHSKNGSLKPENFVSGSNRKVWWLCEKGHSYQAVISSRTMNETKCPYCAGRRVLQGFNDLATVHPAIAAQWHKTFNKELTPEMVTSGSHKKVWWKCSEGHAWKAVVYSRTGPDKCGCPVCAGTINKKRAEKYKAMLAEVEMTVNFEGDVIPKNAIEL